MCCFCCRTTGGIFCLLLIRWIIIPAIWGHSIAHSGCVAFLGISGERESSSLPGAAHEIHLRMRVTGFFLAFSVETVMKVLNRAGAAIVVTLCLIAPVHARRSPKPRKHTSHSAGATEVPSAAIVSIKKAAEVPI